MIELGSKVKDLVSRFEGMATARVHYLRYWSIMKWFRLILKYFIITLDIVLIILLILGVSGYLK